MAVPSTIGSYEIVEEVGKGPSATVYQAVNTSTTKQVALKVLNVSLGSDPAVIKDLQRAVVVSSPLTNSNIAKVYDSGEDVTYHFIASEFIDGACLQDLIDHYKRFQTEQACHIMQEVAKGLNYAHKQGIVHGNLTPSNIIIEKETGRIVITDFCVSRTLMLHNRSAQSDYKYLGFIAPELSNDSTPDTSSDLFSVGAMMYYMLTGECPARGLVSTPGDALPQMPRLRAHLPKVPIWLETLIARLMAADPLGRDCTIEDFVEEIEVGLDSDKNGVSDMAPLGENPFQSQGRRGNLTGGGSSASTGNAGGGDMRLLRSKTAGGTLGMLMRKQNGPSNTEASIQDAEKRLLNLEFNPRDESSPRPNAGEPAMGPGERGLGSDTGFGGLTGSSPAPSRPQQPGSRRTQAENPALSQTQGGRTGAVGARRSRRPQSLSASFAPSSDSTPSLSKNLGQSPAHFQHLEVTGHTDAQSESGGFGGRRSAAPHAGGSSRRGSMSQTGNFGQVPQAGGFEQLPQTGGFGQPPQTGGFGQPPQTGGFEQPPQTGGFGQPPQTGGFEQPPQTGGFGQPPQTGGFGQPPQAGGFPTGSQGFDSNGFQPIGGFPQQGGGFEQPGPGPMEQMDRQRADSNRRSFEPIDPEPMPVPLSTNRFDSAPTQPEQPEQFEQPAPEFQPGGVTPLGYSPEEHAQRNLSDSEGGGQFTSSQPRSEEIESLRRSGPMGDSVIDPNSIPTFPPPSASRRTLNEGPGTVRIAPQVPQKPTSSDSSGLKKLAGFLFVLFLVAGAGYLLFFPKGVINVAITNSDIQNAVMTLVLDSNEVKKVPLTDGKAMMRVKLDTEYVVRVGAPGYKDNVHKLTLNSEQSVANFNEETLSGAPRDLLVRITNDLSSKAVVSVTKDSRLVENGKMVTEGGRATLKVPTEERLVVSVKAPGFEDYAKSVTVEPGETTEEMSVTLLRNKGTVNVSFRGEKVAPSKINVALMQGKKKIKSVVLGTDKVSTTFEIDLNKTYTIQASSVLHNAVKKDVKAVADKPDQDLIISMTLAPSLNVVTTPYASVFLDGNSVGKADANGSLVVSGGGLTAGKQHKVTCSRSGYTDSSTKFVAQSGTNRVDLILKVAPVVTRTVTEYQYEGGGSSSSYSGGGSSSSYSSGGGYSSYGTGSGYGGGSSSGGYSSGGSSGGGSSSGGSSSGGSSGGSWGGVDSGGGW